MANETPQVVQTESLIHTPETAGVTASSVRKSKAPAKRGRPKKATAMVPVTTASLTRTTRRIAKPKTSPKIKAAPAAPRVTLLNRLVNISVVAAVFVTALAIQRIVPTESVVPPKVESLPAQAAAPAPITAPVPAPTTTPETAAATPPEAPAPQPKAKAVAKSALKKPVKTADHHTTLNAGGTEDLDSEAARQAYLAKTKTATRTATPTK